MLPYQQKFNSNVRDLELVHDPEVSEKEIKGLPEEHKHWDVREYMYISIYTYTSMLYFYIQEIIHISTQLVNLCGL